MPHLSDEWDWDEYWDKGGPHMVETWGEAGFQIIIIDEEGEHVGNDSNIDYDSFVAESLSEENENLCDGFE